MRSFRGTVNRVELIGRLGADPEVRQVGNGVSFCRFSLATNRPGGTTNKGSGRVKPNGQRWKRGSGWQRCVVTICRRGAGLW